MRTVYAGQSALGLQGGGVILQVHDKVDTSRHRGGGKKVQGPSSLGWLSSLLSEAGGVVRQVLGWEAALYLKKPSGVREGPLGRGHGAGGSGAPRELLR